MKKNYHLLLYTLILGASFLQPHKNKAQVKADPQDSLVMLAFQQDLIDHSWPTFWNTEQPLSEWAGIQLDPSTGKIIKLKMDADDVADQYIDPENPPALFMLELESFPSSSIQLLSQLSALKELYLIQLGLRNLPPNLGNLTGLTDLYLGFNYLETLPDEINQLINLEFLYLGSNQLTSLPNLTALSKLQRLSFTYNRTLETVPPSIFELRNLISLRLDYCSFPILPPEIQNLDKLELLDMGQGVVTELPDEIGELSSLQILNLKNNQLTALPESMGGQMQALTDLDVSNNLLSALPSSLVHCPVLRNIKFDNNLLTAYPSCLVNNSKLTTVSGKDNQMSGNISRWAFYNSDLKLYLSGNNFSESFDMYLRPHTLELEDNNFNFSDLEAVYNRMKNTNSNLTLHPQKAVGTYRTFTPAAGEEVTITVDDYNPLEGEVFNWYRIDYIESLEAPSFVRQGQNLEFPSFNPQTDGGVYYCQITHQDMPELTLKSHYVRVMGKNKSPNLSARDMTVRSSELPVELLVFGGGDDFTYNKDLIFNLPEESPHLWLDSLPSLTENIEKRSIRLKDASWSGTDTVTVAVSDEHGNTRSDEVLITILPEENRQPQVDIPNLYLTVEEGPLCDPDSPDCSGWDASYIWSISLLPNQFVSDDVDPIEDLTFGFKEANEDGEVSPFVWAETGNSSFQTILYGIVVAQEDTVVNLTLMVTDTEGGLTEYPLILICKTDNQHPQLAAIPEQFMLKGGAFSALDLKPYVSDDYTQAENFSYTAFPGNNATVLLENGVAQLTPSDPDALGSFTVSYQVFEDYSNPVSIQVTYTILESSLTISGTILADNQQPLAEVSMQGLGQEVITDENGSFSAELPAGWNGTLTPVKSNYVFSPTSRTISNLQADQGSLNFEGTYTPPSTFTLSGQLLDTEGSPLEQLTLTGLPENISTDEQGNYSLTLPENWSGTIVPQKVGHTFSPQLITINNLQQNLEGQDFIGFPRVYYTFSGQIVDTEGNPLEQVLLNGLPGNLSTDAQGNYSITLSENWSGTITPQKEGYSFLPASIDINNLQEDLIEQGFTATADPVTYTLSGQILDTERRPITQVTLSGLPGNLSTDALGRYSVTLDENWNGTISPQKEGYSFSPTSIPINSLQQDLIGQNFTATPTTPVPVTYVLSGKVVDTEGNPLEQVTLSGLPENVLSLRNGRFMTRLLENWSGTITPQKE
ncbi:hypothetical protein, partial [Xanthovirga aplysinae]|uniref:leucine-rich repeat domain-containing protein n=1 Tax=Xanthovirga aplysinae TaxID=2529853 RepID=UPI00165758C1|nr:hypothetical protein [Xanthovirga aplysinae]